MIIVRPSSFRSWKRLITCRPVARSSAPVGSSASSDGGKAIVPYPAAMRLSGSNTVRSLTLYLKDSSLSSETVDNVKQLLDSALN